MSSDNALIKVGPQQLQQGGQGLDFSDPLFQLKPATLAINQRMTQAEGAIPGKLRITETGDQFDEMSVALLEMPTKQRQWYQGEPGQLSRSVDNLMCFSTDCETPDLKAKVPQAQRCNGCPRSSWDRWREKKDATGINDVTLIPPCDEHYRALFIDTVYKLPIRMYIRGGENKASFEAGMQELARKFKLLQSQDLNPNIFDLRFTIGVKPGKKKTNYVMTIDGKSIKLIPEDEKAEFGGVYLQFANRNKRTPEQVAAEQVEAESDAIDAELIEPGNTATVNAVTSTVTATNSNGEIVI